MPHFPRRFFHRVFFALLLAEFSLAPIYLFQPTLLQLISSASLLRQLSLQASLAPSSQLPLPLLAYASSHPPSLFPQLPQSPLTLVSLLQLNVHALVKVLKKYLCSDDRQQASNADESDEHHGDQDRYQEL